MSPMLMNPLFSKLWAAGLFGPNSKSTNPTPVKDGFPAILDWVASCPPSPLAYLSLTRFSPDVSFTQAPPWVKAYTSNEHEKTARFWDLARLSFPDARRQWLNSGQPIEQTPSPFLGVIEDPDQQMLCMDYLYYVGAITVCCCCRSCRIHPLTPSYRKVNTKTTSPLPGDLSSPTCTGLSA